MIFNFLCIFLYLHNSSCSAPIMKRIIRDTQYYYTYHQYSREKVVEFMFLKNKGHVWPEVIYGNFNNDGIPHVFGKHEIKMEGTKFKETAHFLICSKFMEQKHKGASAWHFKTLYKGKVGDKYFATDFIRPAFLWVEPRARDNRGDLEPDNDGSAQMKTFNAILDPKWNNIKEAGFAMRSLLTSYIKKMFYDDKDQQAFKSLEKEGKQILFFKNNTHLLRRLILDVTVFLRANLGSRVTGNLIGDILSKYINEVNGNENFEADFREFNLLKMKYAFVNDIINIMRYVDNKTCRFEIYEAGDIPYPIEYEKVATYRIELPTNDNYSDSDISVQSSDDVSIDFHSQMKIGKTMYLCFKKLNGDSLRKAYSFVIEGDNNFYVTDLSFLSGFNWE